MKPCTRAILVAACLLIGSGCRKSPPPDAAAPVPVAAPARAVPTVTLSFRAADAESREQALEVVRRRLVELERQDLLPTSIDSNVRMEGDGRIVVQLALPQGASCEALADLPVDLVERAVSRTGNLAFHRLADDVRLVDMIAGIPALAELRTLEPTMDASALEVSGMTETSLRAALADVKPPDGLMLLVGPRSTRDAQPTEATLYAVEAAPVLKGADLRDASVVVDDGTRPDVNVVFTKDAGDRFSDLTDAIVGEPLPIAYEGRVLMAPVVRERIPGGKALISLGSGSPEQLMREAQELVAVLRAGSLQHPLELDGRAKICP
jgi:preprotein translocase subunit SecD